MERRAYFQEFWIIALLMISFMTLVESSHLLNSRRARGRYLNIQDRVLESCRGHFMCEVFPFYDSFGLNCLNVSKVCDGTRHCRDGSDELPAICFGWNGTPPSRQIVRGPSNRVVRIIRTGTPKNIASSTPGHNIDASTSRHNQAITGGASGEMLSGDTSNVDVISTTITYNKAVDSTTYPSISNNLQRTNLIADPVSPSVRQRVQRPGRTMFDSLSRFMQASNPFASFYTGVQNIEERPNVFGSDYYTTEERHRNWRRNSIINESKPRNLRNRNHRRRNRNQRKNIAEADYVNSALSNRLSPFPGSSYLDTAVSTPSPNIPDGFIYKPGKEPHLAAEERFLEQQFYLTNELPGTGQHNKQRVPNDQNGQKSKLTEREQIVNQMQMSRSRQEKLLRQQLFGLNSKSVGKNEPNRERYGVNGPFDGGVPSVPGEVKGLNNMDGSEAQSAIHNVEALH